MSRPSGSVYIDDLSMVYTSQTPVPVAGLIGLGALAAMAAVSGVVVIRRKQ